MNKSNNPFNVRLEKVIITKFNGTDRMDITPQIQEFTLHQSIFSPVIKADMVLSDLIGLMNNYPLSGEETVEVDIIQEGEEEPGTNTKSFRKV
jgi:hypothetical protein